MSEVLTYSFGSGHLPIASVNLQVIELLGLSSEVETDERGNYICNKVTARWKTILQPAVNSFRTQGKALRQEFGHMPTVSEQALTFWLQQPRGRLTWTINGQTQLQSPLPGKTVDSRNGPIPRVVAITKINGARCFEIVWELTTYLAEGWKYINNPPIVLSNVWSMSETLTDSYLSVRQIEGRATFDTARFPAGVTADDYRSLVLPICPRNFKRAPVVCSLSADSATLFYSITDTEQRVRLEIPDITRITVQRSADFLAPSTVTTVSSIADAVGNIVGAGVGGGARASKRNVGLRGLVPEIPSFAGAALGFARALQTSLPSISHQVQVRVWGTRRASIFWLTQKALQIAQYHLRREAINTNGIFTTQAFHVLQDISSGMVQVSYMVSVPPTITADSTIAAAGTVFSGQFVSNALQNLVNFMLLNKNGYSRDDEYAPSDANPTAQPTGGAVGMALGSSIPPGGKLGTGTQCRGYANAKLFAQALQDPAAIPTPPNLPGRPTASTPPLTDT